ncbi:hypothetical protein OJAV_G00215990 [Oryzias javanicus]|uniref:Uncharacterized protein n=1 Tax=Oryzias javanicus TaxID=123683 RepID=A0A437C4A0_ORYJA|nr:hypothetical protein OJAV_G00215990 [Oryzias javanicus]
MSPPSNLKSREIHSNLSEGSSRIREKETGTFVSSDAFLCRSLGWPLVGRASGASCGWWSCWSQRGPDLCQQHETRQAFVLRNHHGSEPTPVPSPEERTSLSEVRKIGFGFTV